MIFFQFFCLILSFFMLRLIFWFFFTSSRCRYRCHWDRNQSPSVFVGQSSRSLWVPSCGRPCRPLRLPPGPLDVSPPAPRHHGSAPGQPQCCPLPPSHRCFPVTNANHCFVYSHAAHGDSDSWAAAPSWIIRPCWITLTGKRVTRWPF